MTGHSEQRVVMMEKISRVVKSIGMKPWRMKAMKCRKIQMTKCFKIKVVKAITTSLHSCSVLGRVIVESLTKSFN